MNFNILCGDNVESLKEIADDSLDVCITDPPYGMGMEDWDYSIPPTKTWNEVYRVLKPGAFCLSFCSTHLYHRMAVNVEDAGFAIKDMIFWLVTTKMAKKNRLKPAFEPIVVGQKPYEGSLQNNFDKWGAGLINIKGNKVPWDGKPPTGWIKGGTTRRNFGKDVEKAGVGAKEKLGTVDADPEGRYPSNIVGDTHPYHQKYFYAPRVSRQERNEGLDKDIIYYIDDNGELKWRLLATGENNPHPTPKPVSLMRWLVRIFSPVNGKVLDPYNGTGSTGIASMLEDRTYLGLELDQNYCDISEKRIKSFSLYSKF